MFSTSTNNAKAKAVVTNAAKAVKAVNVASVNAAKAVKAVNVASVNAANTGIILPNPTIKNPIITTITKGGYRKTKSRKTRLRKTNRK